MIKRIEIRNYKCFECINLSECKGRDALQCVPADCVALNLVGPRADSVSRRIVLIKQHHCLDRKITCQKTLTERV